jgi:hypothetical protein
MIKKSQLTITLLATLIATNVFAQCIPGGPCRRQKNGENENNGYYNQQPAQWNSEQGYRSQQGEYQQPQYGSQYGYDQYQQNYQPQNYQQNYAPQGGAHPTHLEYTSKDGKFPAPPADHPVHPNQAGGYYQGQYNQGQYNQGYNQGYSQGQFNDGNKNFNQSNWSTSTQPSSYHFAEETYGATSVNNPGQPSGTTGTDSSGNTFQKMFKAH